MGKSPRVVYFHETSDAWRVVVGPWRVTWPLDELVNRRGYPAWVETEVSGSRTWERLLMPGPNRPDLIVVPRGFSDWSGGDQLVARLRNAGIALAGEYDDDVLGAPELTAEMTEGSDTAAQALEARRRTAPSFLRAVDGVIAATEPLAATFRPHVRPGTPVVAVPNAILPAPYVAAREYERKLPPVVIGWAGTPRWEGDFVASGMADAWARIAQRFENVTFLTIGGEPAALADRLPRARYRRWPAQWPETYARALANVDVACCPLEATPFNACKSPQKAWEWALTGAAAVCSPTVYGDDARFVECGGLLAADADEWESHLARLIECEQERRERVEQLQQFVLDERSVFVQADRWVTAWQTIVDHARARRVSSRKPAKRKRRR